MMDKFLLSQLRQCQALLLERAVDAILDGDTSHGVDIIRKVITQLEEDHDD
jgi:hypothetical protein